MHLRGCKHAVWGPALPNIFAAHCEAHDAKLSSPGSQCYHTACSPFSAPHPASYHCYLCACLHWLRCLLWLQGLPLGSGMGSSAASAAAAAWAVNGLFGSPVPKETLIMAGLAAEASVSGYHADNIGPSLLGGFVLIRWEHVLPMHIWTKNSAVKLFGTCAMSGAGHLCEQNTRTMKQRDGSPAAGAASKGNPWSCFSCLSLGTTFTLCLSTPCSRLPLLRCVPCFLRKHL